MTIKEAKKNIFEHAYPTIYIIGGAGFVASYVIELLIKENYNILSFDNFITGKEENIKKFNELKTFKNLEIDINTELPEDLPPPEYIVHMGGIEEYLEGQDISLNTMLVNAIGTYKTLEIARKNKSKYLLVSSLDIYSGVVSSTDMENYFGISERDTRRYTHHEAKRYAEALVTEYFKKYELDAKIVRISDTYGPRMNIYTGTEIANLLRNAVESDTLTIQGDGLKIINLTYITDIADGIVEAMKKQACKGKIINLASPEEVNILNLAYTIQKNSTKPLKIQFSPEYKEIKIPKRKIELEQTEKLINWKPKTSLDQGITETLEYLYLNTNKIDKQTKTETSKIETHEIPYIPPPTKKTPQEQEKKQLKTKNIEEKKEKTKNSKEKNNINIVNTTIVSISLFTVLLLFVFPLTSIYYATKIAIEKANTLKNPLEEQKKQNETIKNIQKNTAFANAQLDTVEWFYSMTQQRSKFEGTRSTIALIDKYAQAIERIEKSQITNNAIQKEILNGRTNNKNTESNTKKTSKAIALLENTLLEYQTATENILDKKQKNAIKNIVDKTNKNLKTMRTVNTLQQNALTYFTPTKDKYIAFIFLDPSYINQEGGKIYGYMIMKTTTKGITETHFINYDYEENDYMSLTKHIKKSAEKINLGTIEAVVLLNDYARNNIIKALKHVPNTKYAQIFTYENIKSKEDEYKNNQDFKLSVWETIWETLKKQTSYNEINQQIIKDIEDENIQILITQNDGKIKIPECNEENALKLLFSQTINKNENRYCIIPKIVPDKQRTDIEIEIKATARVKNDAQEIKTIIEIDNKEKNNEKINISLTVPGKPQITNVEAPYPISFDRVKKIIKATSTTWEYQTEVKANNKNTITFEWFANISDGNIEKNGIIVEKQYGLNKIKLSGEIINDKNKTIKKEAKNKDLTITNNDNNQFMIK